MQSPSPAGAVRTSLGWSLAALAMLLPGFVLAGTRVLYVSHEPGRWHDYTRQREVFQTIAADAGWDLTVISGDKEAMLAFLRRPDYAAGQDAIVYNFCLADSRDIAAMDNLMRQTREGGVPAVLVHCAMHSWWDTFRKGRPIEGNALGLARANRRLLKQWTREHPHRPLPAWGDFTGIASTRHGPQAPIELSVLATHPVTADVPAQYQTAHTELYNNHYVTPGVVPLLQGRQGGDSAVVGWEASRGKSRIIGLTLGHNSDEWQDPVFVNLLTNSVTYLMGDD